MYRSRSIVLSIAVALGTSFTAFAAEDSQPVTLPGADQPLPLLKVLRITLDNAPKLKLQGMAVSASKAQEQIAKGKFDISTAVVGGYQTISNTTFAIDELTPEHAAAFPKSYPNELVNNMDVPYLSAELSKKFRNGIATGLSATIQRQDYRQTLLRATPTVTENRTTVKFTVKIPLLQGAGSVSGAAKETGARLEKEASISEVQHTLTAVMLESIKAYWDYKRAISYLEKVEESKNRIAGWVDGFGAGNSSLQAYLENAKGKASDAQQTLEESRIALAQAMGVPAKQTVNIGLPISEVPMNWENALNGFDQEKMGTQWQALAIENRLDLKAAELRLEGARVQQAQARQDRLPTLNLDLGAGYSGFQQYDGMDDFFGSANSNISRIDTAASLTFSYPLGNNVAEGSYALTNVLYQKSLITRDEAQRVVRLDAGRSVSNVYGRLQKAVQMRKSFLSYKEAVQQMQQNNEFLSTPSGIATLIETEDKFINSLNDFYTAVADVAKAIAESRFNTGTLILITGEMDGDVDLNRIISFPAN